MNIAQLIQLIAVYALPLLFALAFHEAAHAYMAAYLGDKTPAMTGRLTLNPIRHLDPVGSIALPLIGLLSTAGMPGGPLLLGYAKTPVQPRFFKHPRRDNILVAVAGPASNLVQAIVWAVFGYVLIGTGIDERFFIGMANAGIHLNLVLAAFNLFPLPPLDGGKILSELLPWRLSQAFARIAPFGFFIVLGLAMTGLLNSIWMSPLVTAGQTLVSAVTLPLALISR